MQFMVTERAAYVGTSNWSADYFVDTAGVGVVVGQACTTQANTTNTTDCADNSIRQRVEKIFLRNWNSIYSHPAGLFRPFTPRSYLL